MKRFPERPHTRWALLATLALLCAIGGLGARHWILRVKEQPVVGGPLRYLCQSSSLGKVEQPESDDALAVYVFASNVTRRSILINGERASPTYALREYRADGKCDVRAVTCTPWDRPVSEAWTDLRPDEELVLCITLGEETVAFELGLLLRERPPAQESEPHWFFSERFHLIALRGLTFARSTPPSQNETTESDEREQDSP